MIGKDVTTEKYLQMQLLQQVMSQHYLLISIWAVYVNLSGYFRDFYMITFSQAL